MSALEDLLLFRRHSSSSFSPGQATRRELKQFAVTLRAQVARERNFCCLVTGDRELRRLNARFLGREYPADVLAFPAEPNPEHFLGELAISGQRAEQQARDLGHSVDQEIKILMLHGLLHLLGMDHQVDCGQMARAEARWRRKLGLPPGLIERVRA